MTEYLPFENTRISAQQSLSEIVGLLNLVGFDDILQATIQGEKFIQAHRDGCTFEFRVHLDNIKDKLSSRRVRGRVNSGDLQAKAERIAWRILRERVKAVTDVIRYEVEDVAHSLGGNLLIKPSGGKSITVGEWLTDNIKNQQLESPNIFKRLTAK